VLDATVFGEKHALTGNIVCANINIELPVDDQKLFIKELKSFLKKQLKSFKVPVKINIIETPLHSGRYKKQREKNKSAE